MNSEDFAKAIPTAQDYLADVLNNDPESKWDENIKMHRTSYKLTKLLANFTTVYNMSCMYHEMRRTYEKGPDGI